MHTFWTSSTFSLTLVSKIVAKCAIKWTLENVCGALHSFFSVWSKHFWIVQWTFGWRQHPQLRMKPTLGWW